MKYIKTYSTKAQAVADTTVVCPLTLFCLENSQVFLYNKKPLDTHINLIEQNGVITVYEQPPVTILTTNIEDTTIQFESGMQWGQWVGSKYNTLGLISDNGDIVSGDGTKRLLLSGQAIIDDDEIEENKVYYLEAIA